jgi:hypothetical protein
VANSVAPEGTHLAERQVIGVARDHAEDDEVGIDSPIWNNVESEYRLVISKAEHARVSRDRSERSRTVLQ